MNQLLNSTQFYWFTADVDGSILSTNAAFKRAFPDISVGHHVVHPIDRDKIPDKAMCEKSPFRPLDVELMLIDGCKSVWYISSFDSLIVYCIGLPCTVNPAATAHFLNHDVLGHVMSIKGLISLLDRESAGHLTGQIYSRLEMAVQALEEKVARVNGG